MTFAEEVGKVTETQTRYFAGTSHLIVVLMGRCSEPGSSPTVHSVPGDQALLTAVMSGVLRLPVLLFTHVAVPSLRMLAFWERSK